MQDYSSDQKEVLRSNVARGAGLLAAWMTTFAICLTAHANTGEIYGYGSRASAMGNTMLGGSTGGFATYYNPAVNSTLPGLHLGIGLAYYDPSFDSIKNVVTDNSATNLVGVTYGDIDTNSYLAHFGQMLGASVNFGERVKNLSIGVVGFLPIERLALLDTGEALKPEYFNYRSRTQRPQIYASLSVSPFKNLHTGTGVAFATNLSASTNLFASTADGSISHQRFASTIKPSVAPYFSIYADPPPWRAGIVVRMPNKYNVAIDTDAKLNVFGGLGNFTMRTNSSSALFYDPLEVDLALGYQVTQALWATLEVDWLQYKAFESPSLTITSRPESSARVMNSVTNLPTMQNIFIPKVGVQYTTETLAFRAGYFYRPSPIKDSSGTGNLVDPAQHVGTLGVGLNLQKLKVTEKELFLDLHGQYHQLVKAHVTKTPGNEVGNAAEPKVGSPGYDVGGQILGGGLSLSMNF